MRAGYNADVLVVGLGPAGASAAALAARGGAGVIAIDRKREAGLPVQCAEFVPAMLGSTADVNAAAETEPSSRQRIVSMTTFVGDADAHVKDHFPGRMIDRAHFDASLVAAAERCGATCRFGVGLVRLDNEGHAHLSDGRKVKARIVIGSDGPHSRVGRAIGRINQSLVWTRQITVPLLRPSRSTDIFLADDIPGGYAWLFPKTDVANLGVGVAPGWRHNLKSLLEQLHSRLVEEGRVGKAASRLTGGAIPVGGMLDPTDELGDAVVLLAGDAAGLTNSITGAGINAAIASGHLAGEAAVSHLAGRGRRGRDYADDIEDLFASSLNRATGRRCDLMKTYDGNELPTRADLERSWIAFPQYWAANQGVGSWDA